MTHQFMPFFRLKVSFRREQMQLHQLIENLKSDSTRNDSLSLLFSVLEAKSEDLIRALASLILNPEKISDTNEFASILVKLPSEKYIPKLIDVISVSSPVTTPWLADYMYVLVDLLQEREDCYPAEESFVNLIGSWIFTTGGGEISWKSGDILLRLEHPATKPFFFRGAVDRTLLHLTRISCFRGIINHYRNDADPIIKELLSDPNKHVKTEAINVQKWIDSKI